MKTLKNLDMDKVNKLFDEHFTVDKAELEQGFTMWTFTPKREVKLLEEDKQND
jgi:hypothetical protein